MSRSSLITFVIEACPETIEYEYEMLIIRDEVFDRVPALMERTKKAELRMAAMHKALLEVLGAQHVLRAAFRTIELWKDDRNMNPTEQCEYIAKWIGEWHKRLVAASNVGGEDERVG